jgi:hypothetical protein
MRTPAEIRFRLRQEVANVALWLAKPTPKLQAFPDSPVAGLPNAATAVSEARGTAWADRLVLEADQVCQGRVPLLGQVIDVGPEPAWRRDWATGIESAPVFFRRIPYLDVGRVGDHKNIWELSRHQHLVLLAQAWVLTGRPHYLDFLFGQLRHWWQENPFQQGINWNSALEVAFRALSWIWIWHLAGDRMEPEFRRQFFTELYRHARHLEYNLSVYFSPNTHLLGEAVALHAIGKLFPSLPGSDRWAKLAHDVVKQQLEIQVRPDGGYFEQSTYYHVYAVDMFVFHHLLEPLPEAPLRRMAEFLASVVGPDDSLPFLGDDDGGRFFFPFGERRRFARATLTTCSLLFGERYLSGCGEEDRLEQAVWWLSRAKLRSEPKTTYARASRAFPDTGLICLRDNDLRLLFDAGPFGPWSGGHSHSDTLGFVLQIGDTELLIDPGTYTYVGDREWRDRFRGSAAHNTIRVDYRDQALPQGPFRWADKPVTQLIHWESTDRQDVAEGRCEYGGIVHRRRVTLSKPDWIVRVEDHLEGHGEHDVEQFWHLGDGMTDGPWLQLDSALQRREERGWRSDGLGTRRQSGPVIGGEARCPFPARFQTVIDCRLALPSL